MLPHNSCTTYMLCIDDIAQVLEFILAMLGILNHLWILQAISELNIKAKNWKDLLTDEPFTRKDILHIQDPLNFQNKVVRDFEHMKKQLTAEDAPEGDGAELRNVSDDTRRVLESLGTSTAKAAYESGGGGKAVEARRILAAERNRKATKQVSDEKTKTMATTGGESEFMLLVPLPSMQESLYFTQVLKLQNSLY